MKQLIKRTDAALGAHYTHSEVSALARIIITELLGFSQTAYLLKDNVTLTPSEEKIFSDALERLVAHEPIQYILGYCDFCGLRFKVSPAVLIPRPETSELVEWIEQESEAAERLLDIGTGSGCIAVALAHRLPHTGVTAWDISPDALTTASTNSTANGCNVKFAQCDILTYIPGNEKFDIIVSNPPYIKEAEKQEMEKNVLLWEPHLALFVPDENPLLFYRTIAEKSIQMLNAGGKLFFEINREHGNDIIEMLASMGYREITLRKDIAGNDRMICAKKPSQL